ncbi:MAG: sugar transferase [Desulfobacterium sp.]|nr:sugar transferase [Desulfobacterium sp.]
MGIIAQSGSKRKGKRGQTPCTTPCTMHHFLPMLYNLVKGDFSLVGVRPLSFQYLSMQIKRVSGV